MLIARPFRGVKPGADHNKASSIWFNSSTFRGWNGRVTAATLVRSVEVLLWIAGAVLLRAGLARRFRARRALEAGRVAG